MTASVFIFFYKKCSFLSNVTYSIVSVISFLNISNSCRSASQLDLLRSILRAAAIAGSFSSTNFSNCFNCCFRQAISRVRPLYNKIILRKKSRSEMFVGVKPNLIASTSHFHENIDFKRHSFQWHSVTARGRTWPPRDVEIVRFVFSLFIASPVKLKKTPYF